MAHEWQIGRAQRVHSAFDFADRLVGKRRVNADVQPVAYAVLDAYARARQHVAHGQQQHEPQRALVDAAAFVVRIIENLQFTIVFGGPVQRPRAAV